ncbi:hypothetical protein Sjap_010348 [Stephania japonica]|uniref:Uncharacterized protein n=1 Tax=Stephania japonica TaxID=461633 RepID=A0AAP0J9A1_9MAGN
MKRPRVREMSRRERRNGETRGGGGVLEKMNSVGFVYETDVRRGECYLKEIGGEFHKLVIRFFDISRLQKCFLNSPLLKFCKAARLPTKLFWPHLLSSSACSFMITTSSSSSILKGHLFMSLEISSSCAISNWGLKKL